VDLVGHSLPPQLLLTDCVCRARGRLLEWCCHQNNWWHAILFLGVEDATVAHLMEHGPNLNKLEWSMTCVYLNLWVLLILLFRIQVLTLVVLKLAPIILTRLVIHSKLCLDHLKILLELLIFKQNSWLMVLYRRHSLFTTISLARNQECIHRLLKQMQEGTR